ncbi:MAG: TraR/DksA C4-type zinc finger protein [Gemmatimonadetes bacterium]|nr:TraR/DksA C4-type zinc finger protein [Gemmatimonadota bacterium]
MSLPIPNGGARSESDEGPVLSKEQLAHLEERLLEERERALRGLDLFNEAAQANRAAGDSNLAAYTDHMADQGTEAMEREKAALFATKEGRYLYRLQEALRRLYRDPDNFGRCRATGRPIGFERLDALPHARYCIEHKRELEASGG